MTEQSASTGPPAGAGNDSASLPAGPGAPGAPSDPPPPGTPFVSLWDIAKLLGRIGLTSFGGGLSAWLYREVVGNRKWLPEEDFLGALTMSQILPGANIVNLAIYVGHRLRGAMGATVAVAALIAPPMVIVITVTSYLQSLPPNGWLHDILEGVAASAIGLTAAMGLRTAQRSWTHGRWTLLIVLAAFAGVGLMQWPLIPVVLVLGVIGWFLARSKPKAESGAKDA